MTEACLTAQTLSETPLHKHCMEQNIYEQE
jgi:hypothetical protein